jgi:hypothetical protein
VRRLRDAELRDDLEEQTSPAQEGGCAGLLGLMNR